MFGKNKLTKPRYEKNDLRVVNIWATLQGEGPLTGLPSAFVRLAGCNLACWFCDTSFDDGEVLTVEEMLAAIKALHYTPPPSSFKWIVLTGGEPMIQNIMPFCYAALNSGYNVQIETAGTVVPPGLEAELALDRGLMLVCSPKTAHVHPVIQRHCKHWKYIVRAGTDLIPPMNNTQDKDSGKMSGRLFFPKNDGSNVIWVQPMDEYVAEDKEQDLIRHEQRYACNMRETTRLAMQYGYRVSLQTHKILGVE